MSELENCSVNVADALDFLASLSDASASLAFFDPQHRAVLDKLKFGNEGARQRGRASLPAMSEDYIDTACREIARVLKPGGYLMRWMDTFCLCEGHHLRIVSFIKPVDLIAWDSLRNGMGKRSRRRGDYLLILQKPPVSACSWRNHGISNRWPEKVDRRIHPHIKPIGLIAQLIGAVTERGDLVIDPAAGSFVVMRAALHLGRTFAGCDLITPADTCFAVPLIDEDGDPIDCGQSCCKESGPLSLCAEHWNALASPSLHNVLREELVADVMRGQRCTRGLSTIVYAAPREKENGRVPKS